NAAGRVGQICELKLHQQIDGDVQQTDDGGQQSDDDDQQSDDQQTDVGDQKQGGFKLNIKMEIRLCHDVSLESTRSVISMHYFELYKCSNTKAQ
ncbi:hypothetical protein BGX21_007987, partial [Mortierella sp. AD011]